MDVTAELRQLRARAYGPDADIADDPVALRRLEELEALARPVRVPVAEPADEPERAAKAAEVDAGEPAAATAVPPESVSPPARSRFVRWLPVAWVASLLAVAGFASAATYATASVLLPPIAHAPGAEQVDVLALGPGVSVPGLFEVPADGAATDAEIPRPLGYEDYYGLTIVTLGSQWTGREGEPCFMVVDPGKVDAETNSFNGPVYSACGVSGFPVAVAFRVGSEEPAALRERFPEGTALQFLLDGDRVGVFVAAAQE